MQLCSQRLRVWIYVWQSHSREMASIYFAVFWIRTLVTFLPVPCPSNFIERKLETLYIMEAGPYLPFTPHTNSTALLGNDIVTCTSVILGFIIISCKSLVRKLETLWCTIISRQQKCAEYMQKLHISVSESKVRDYEYLQRSVSFQQPVPQKQSSQLQNITCHIL